MGTSESDKDTPAQLAVMWRKFMRLTRGRVPALRALEVMGLEEKNQTIKELLSALNSGLSNGMTLSEAAGSHNSLVSASVLELLRHAEKTGAWDEILEEIAGGLEEGTFTA